MNTPDLCFTCHQDLQQQLAASPVVHGAVTEPGGCLGCHTPHSSALPMLQREGQIDLCLSCHDREITTADGRTLTNMAKLLADNPDHHGPIREGSCTACHQPHDGQRHNMLVADYPPQFYAPFDTERYALCFGCHRPELVTDEHGRGVTRFRKGDVNLHWLHVNREKGRTCRACHEVHASKRPFHIREAVPFGTSGWMLEIHFQQTPTGGSCAPGCHDPQSYSYAPSPPASARRSDGGSSQ